MKINNSNPNTANANGTKKNKKAFESAFKDSNANDVQTKGLTSYKSAVESAEAKVKASEPKITTAAAKVTSAQTKLSAAKNVLNNTKPTIDKQIQTGTDANNQPVFKTIQEPNPAYQAAQDAVNAAEGELSTAEGELSAAESEKATAEEEKSKAEVKLTKVEKENEEAQEALNGAENNIENETEEKTAENGLNEYEEETLQAIEQENSPFELFNKVFLNIQNSINSFFGNKDNKTDNNKTNNSLNNLSLNKATNTVSNSDTKSKYKDMAVNTKSNLSVVSFDKVKGIAIQNCSSTRDTGSGKNNNYIDKTAELLSNLQEDISISDAVENGTKLINDIKNAASEEELRNVILAECENNSESAEKIFNYIMENKPANNAYSTNPYKGVSNIYLTNLLYSNNGGKLVLNENLLGLFTETTVTADIDGKETEIPKKEYYVNYTGEICSIDYKYHEAKEDKAEYITMRFNEGDKSSEINFYETQNDNGEVFYHTIGDNGEDKTIETQEEFLKRLVIARNYTKDVASSELSTEEINERYTVLKEADDNVTSSMSTLIREYQSQGWFDERYNEFKELTGLGLTPEELGEELDVTANYNAIMMEAENGNTEKATNLAEKEFNRRLQNVKTWQDAFNELKAYYQDDKTALDIMNNTLCFGEEGNEVFLDDDGKIKHSFKDNSGITHTAQGDTELYGKLSLDKIKEKGNNEVKNYKLDSKETIYKFLYRGGELTSENIDSFHKAEDKFTDYNTTIAYAEALRECKTPEEAFRIITGKDIEKDKDSITDDDIKLFNNYYASNDNTEPIKFVECKENSDRKGNGGSDTPHYYKLNIQFNKEKNDFDIQYQEYSYDTKKQKYTAIGEPSNSIPDYENSRDNENLFQIYNSNGITEKFQQDKFNEFYGNNSEYIDNCINNYANWAINDEKAQEHFKKLMGQEPKSADEIKEYIKSEGLYSESANYMQYDYSTKKQTLMGESKLDKLTNDYCTDMATYTSKVAHGLTMGFLAASIFLPLTGAAATAISFATRASGYVDNVIDFINMATNKQNYLDDNYANLLTSTTFEVFTKQGYKFFSGVASNWADSIFGNPTSLKDILLKGSFEALSETAVSLPFTAAVKKAQGGEYNFWEELKENFFYDFLPYAKGWQNLIHDTGAALKTNIDSDSPIEGSSGKYYSSENDSNTRIYVDDNGKPIGVVTVDENGNKTVTTSYEYSKDGDGYTVRYYDTDGNQLSSTKIEDNGNKVTFFGENGKPKMTKTVEETENGTVTKYFRDGAETPDLTETRDKEGHLITSEDSDTKETFDKSGRCVEMVQRTSEGNENTVSYTYKNGIGHGVLKTLSGKEVEITKYQDGTIKYINDNGEEVEIKNKQEYKDKIDSKTLPEDSFWEENPGMDYLRYLIFLDAGAHELIDDAPYNISAKNATSATVFDYDKIQEFGIENLTISTNQKGIRGSSIFAKPNKKFMSELSDAGIEQIIDLRSEANTDKCTRQCANNNLEYTSFPVYYDKKLSPEEIATTKECLPKLINAINKGNFYIGCSEGTNRTDVAFGLNYLFNPEETVIPEFESKSPNKSMQMTRQILNAITNKTKGGGYEISDDFAKSLGWENAEVLEETLKNRLEKLSKANLK